MQPTLLVLAAGIGSRYGGLKQADAMGPGGETIIDYSIYDAIRAGFGAVTFVIRREIETAFRESIAARFESRIPVRYVYQDGTRVSVLSTYRTAERNRGVQATRCLSLVTK